MFETRKCMDRVSSDISGTVFSPNAQFYVYLTFGSPLSRFISLFMMFVDRRHPKVKAGDKKFRKKGSLPGSDLSYGHNTDFHKIESFCRF